MEKQERKIKDQTKLVRKRALISKTHLENLHELNEKAESLNCMVVIISSVEDDGKLKAAYAIFDRHTKQTNLHLELESREDVLERLLEISTGSVK